MQSLASLLTARVEAAAGIDPEMRPATKPQFGHFQSNVALRLAKTEGRPPRDVAADLIVVGDVGLNTTAGRLLGSVPADVARKAKIDILIVHTVD